MKKDSARDYIIEAFRLYARLGEPETEKIRQQVYMYALTNRRRCDILPGAGHISKPTEAAVINAEKVMRHYRGELMDIEAARKTVKTLQEKDSGYDAADILREVYFKNPHLPLKKADIQSRVISSSIKNHISESTTYRTLRSAREIFAYHRGIFMPVADHTAIEDIVS